MLLSKKDIAYRIALYEELRGAYEEFEALDAALPVVFPANLSVDWHESYPSATSAVEAVCKAAWDSLRKAAMQHALRRVQAAERVVEKFEAGENV